MIRVYINYPVKRIAIHADSACNFIQPHHKDQQRFLQISTDNVLRILSRFQNEEFRFAAEPKFNDMWLEIELVDLAAELALVEEIRLIFGCKYKPFAQVTLMQHCGI